MSKKKYVLSWSILLAFWWPVTGGVMFLTGDDTVMSSFSSLRLLSYYSNVSYLL